MADIQAFRGWRYDLAQVGSLSDVVAPPHDAIDTRLQSQLYGRSDFNVARLVLNRGDDLMGDQTVYDRAAEHLKHWRRDGILKQENVGTVYVYHQTFDHEGVSMTRRGFIARVRLEPLGTGSIYPHEQTDLAAKEDRAKLLDACQANASPVLGIYPDDQHVAQDALESAVDDRTPLTAIDHLGVRHELWMVTDPDAIATATNVLGAAPMYIAGGQHSYEAACSIRQQQRQAQSIADEPSSANYTMMMCVGMDDPGLAVLPMHRLFRGVAAISSGELIEKLGSSFECEVGGAGVESAESIWEIMAVEERQSTLGFYCRKDATWVLARLSDDGAMLLADVAADLSDEWRDLGVSMLEQLVIGKLLGYADLPSAKYVHAVSDLIEGLGQRGSSGQNPGGSSVSEDPFELACLVMPATLEHVKSIAENGEWMPPNSTSFAPDPLSGLVVDTLD